MCMQNRQRAPREFMALTIELRSKEQQRLQTPGTADAMTPALETVAPRGSG